MSYNIFRNFGYLLEPVLSDLVETEKHVNGFVAYCIYPDYGEWGVNDHLPQRKNVSLPVLLYNDCIVCRPIVPFSGNCTAKKMMVASVMPALRAAERMWL